MFSYTAIVGSGDGGRAGSCYADTSADVNRDEEENCWEDGDYGGVDS